MLRSLRDLDRILRGDATRLSALRRGTIDISVGGLALVIAGLGILYGLCMGSFALFRGANTNGGLQLLASAVKVPVLFLLTLLITFPSLYVFNALVGSRLSLVSVLQLLVAALAVMLAVLASFGPIVAFFSLSTTSYSFMQLLNVAMFAVAGFMGLKFLLHTLHRLDVAQTEALHEAEAEQARRTGAAAAAHVSPVAPVAPGAEAARPAAPSAAPGGALDRLDGQALGANVRTVFRFWVIVFGLVGAQMSWVLRPFIGAPGTPFEWFRDRSSNFFEAVLRAAGNLLFPGHL